MKRIIVAGAVSALAAVSLAGTASAYEPGEPQCFGQVHKAVNAGEFGVGNVGELLKTFEVTGQGKKALVKGSICVPAS